MKFLFRVIFIMTLLIFYVPINVSAECQFTPEAHTIIISETEPKAVEIVEPQVAEDEGWWIPKVIWLLFLLALTFE
ncbi:MAG: hypothetical protein ACOYWZ_16090 [Bacillota bacterium]